MPGALPLDPASSSQILFCECSHIAIWEHPHTAFAPPLPQKSLPFRGPRIIPGPYLSALRAGNGLG